MLINIDRHHLPDSIPALKELIYALLDIVEEQQTFIASQQKIIEDQQIIIATQQQTIDDQAVQITQLTERVNVLEKSLFGKRSERQKTVSSSGQSVTPKGRHAHGRGILPEDLPRTTQDYELSGRSRICSSCGHFLSKMGEVVSEQLESVPTHLHVIRHRRAKYACKHCEGNIVVAPMPLQPIDKGLAGPGLIAEVMVSKYQEHMPLYRQAQRFKRLGCEISRSTLCGWMMMGAELLKPLIDRMHADLLKGDHIFSDDTPIQVLKRSEDQGKTGRFWIYIRKASQQLPACCVYQFTGDRKSERPVCFLKDFTGYLQADAYSGYDPLYKNDKDHSAKVTPVACWAHARRYFFDAAQGTAPDSLAHQALAFIAQLYQVERESRTNNLKAADLKAWRDIRVPPVLDAFKMWLDTYQPQVLPKSRLAQAINYTLNNWDALKNYLQAGELEIDNNRAERGIRPLALGRKNYLFVGNNRGGQAAATIYSLIETCKQNDINAHTYLKDVLMRISTHPQSKIDELLPYHWKSLNHTNIQTSVINLPQKTA